MVHVPVQDVSIARSLICLYVTLTSFERGSERADQRSHDRSRNRSNTPDRDGVGTLLRRIHVGDRGTTSGKHGRSEKASQEPEREEHAEVLA